MIHGVGNVEMALSIEDRGFRACNMARTAGLSSPSYPRQTFCDGRNHTGLGVDLPDTIAPLVDDVHIALAAVCLRATF